MSGHLRPAGNEYRSGSDEKKIAAAAHRLKLRIMFMHTISNSCAQLAYVRIFVSASDQEVLLANKIIVN